MAAKVEDAVDEESGDLVVEGMSELGGLSGGGVEGDGDVAEEAGFVAGPGDDVGGPVALEPAAVEVVDDGVVGEKDGEFGVLTSQGA